MRAMSRGTRGGRACPTQEDRATPAHHVCIRPELASGGCGFACAARNRTPTSQSRIRPRLRSDTGSRAAQARMPLLRVRLGLKHDTNRLPPSLSRGSYTNNHAHRLPGASSEAHIAARSHRDHRRCRDHLGRHRPHPLPARPHQPDPRMVPNCHRDGGLVLTDHEGKPAGWPCGRVLWWGDRFCAPAACCPAWHDVSVRGRSGSSEAKLSSMCAAPATAVADRASLGQNSGSAGTI